MQGGNCIIIVVSIYLIIYNSIAGPVYEVVGEGEAFGALADQGTNTATTRTEAETDVMCMEPNPVYGTNEIPLEPNPVYNIHTPNTTSD